MKPGKLIIICLAAMTVCSQMDARPKWNPFRKHRKEAVEAPAPKPKKTPLEKFLSKKNLEAVGAHILGVVINGYDTKKSTKKDGYYYSYNYYGYYDEDGSSGKSKSKGNSK